MGKSGKPSPLRGEGRVRGSGGDAASGFSTLHPLPGGERENLTALPLKGGEGGCFRADTPLAPLEGGFQELPL